MLPDDVGPATELILANEWGVRREWLAYAAGSPACRPLVADDDGEIVGTGIATINGPVGWLGTIFLAPAWRGQGLGRGITQALLDALDAAGCRSVALVATREGRRLYERMGFEVQTRYRILEAPGLADDEVAARAGRVRAFEPADLEGMLRLDAEATGEDRRHAFERFPAPSTARVLPGEAGDVDAFVVRAPWGGGATVARTPDAAVTIIDARRRASGPAGRVRVGLLEENGAGIERLLALGFTDQWSAPRMLRGEPLQWHPDWIYGQLNHAMG